MEFKEKLHNILVKIENVDFGKNYYDERAKLFNEILKLYGYKAISIRDCDLCFIVHLIMDGHTLKEATFRNVDLYDWDQVDTTEYNDAKNLMCEYY